MELGDDRRIKALHDLHRHWFYCASLTQMVVFWKKLTGRVPGWLWRWGQLNCTSKYCIQTTIRRHSLYLGNGPLHESFPSDSKFSNWQFGLSQTRFEGEPLHNSLSLTSGRYSFCVIIDHWCSQERTISWFQLPHCRQLIHEPHEIHYCNPTGTV